MENNHIYASPDTITQLALDKFLELPKKGKPNVRSNGVKEWTVLAGIIVETPTCKPKCVSLATGVKAISNDKLSKCEGTVLHDMHAEILAIRGFNRFILEECSVAINDASHYILYKETENHLFFAHPDLKISLYVSEPPCGDASMSVISNGQEDGWGDPLQLIQADSGVVRGRDHFLQVGITRTKPGRRDSPITFSKSCSDKLCLYQVTSLLLGQLTNIIYPEGFYLSDLVIPKAVFKEDDFIRAFNGRLRGGSKRKLSDQEDIPHTFEFPDGYTEKLFNYHCTSKEWGFRKSRNEEDENTKPSPTSILFIDGMPNEAISNGVKMGAKPFLGKGQSCICRKMIWQSLLKLYKLANYEKIPPADMTYVSMKKQNEQRYLLKQQVYDRLNGWVNTKEDDFELYEQ